MNQINKMSTITSPSKVVEIVNDHKSSLSVAEWACKIIVGFTSTAIKTRNTEAFIHLLDDGVCECLVNTMNLHASTSENVAAIGCHALNDLSWTSRELREFLGEIGACECVIYILSMYVGNPDVAEYGTSTVINLSKDINNSYRLAEAGACDVIVQTGNFGFNVRHPKSTIIASNVCHCIYNLCEARNQKKLSESGTCELVTQLLKIHINVYEVVVSAIRAICGLASLTIENREILGKVGACNLIVQAFSLYQPLPQSSTQPTSPSSPNSSPASQSYPSPIQQNHHTLNSNSSSSNLTNNSSNNNNSQILVEYSKYIVLIENCCEAIMHLSLNPNNTERFQHCGGCDVLVQSLDKYLIEREFGSEICCSGMINLSTYGLQTAINIQRLKQLNCLHLMQRVQTSIYSSQRAREYSVILTSLMTESQNNTSRYSQNNGIMVGVVLGSEPSADTIPLQAEVREYIQSDNNNNGNNSGSNSNNNNSVKKKKYLQTVDGVNEGQRSSNGIGSERDEKPKNNRRGSGSLDQQPIFERSSSSYGAERDVYEI